MKNVAIPFPTHKACKSYLVFFVMQSHSMTPFMDLGQVLALVYKQLTSSVS